MNISTTTTTTNSSHLDKAQLRILLLEYSTNVKNYAKWFEISEVHKNEESYTTYKVVYRFLPKDINESIKELKIWKRFRDFKELNQIMFDYHVSLHRKDKFPEFVRSKFFGRFDDKIIEERRQCSLRLLQFIGSQSHLYRHEKFIEFLLDGNFSDYAMKSAKILNPNGKILSNSLTTTTTPPNSTTKSATIENQQSNTKHNNNISSSTRTRNNDLKSPSSSSTSSLFSNTLIECIQNLKIELDNLLNDKEIKENKDYEHISLFIDKSSRYINLAITNENLKYHFASYKLLKSAANTLENFLKDIETSQTENISLNIKKKRLLREIIVQLNLNSEQISKTNLIDLEDLTNDSSTSKPTQSTGEHNVFNLKKLNENIKIQNKSSDLNVNKSADDLIGKSVESNMLNDWILSDFNLLSNDFNTELDFICGNIFDLNFSYKFHRILNGNCLLMKLRCNQDSFDIVSDTKQTELNKEKEIFVLKRLQKSSSPNLTSKCIVPLANQIPFMCQLIKYFETDNTIFLLLEYYPYGKLFNHLDLLIESGDSFLKTLRKNFNESRKGLKNLLKSNNKSIAKRRRSLSIRPNTSTSCLISLEQADIMLNKKRSQSVKAELSPLIKKLSDNNNNNNNDNKTMRNKLTEINLDKIEYVDNVEQPSNDDINISSASSISSIDSNTALSSSNDIIAQQQLVNKSKETNRQSNLHQLDESIAADSSNKFQIEFELKNTIKSTPNDDYSSSSFSRQTKSDPRLSAKVANSVKSTKSTKKVSLKQENEQISNENFDELAATTKLNWFDSNPYYKQVKLWLAQFLSALRGLHLKGITCKDLRPDNLLLNSNGQLILTFMSKWNLVEEQISRDAIKNNYIAPELCGLVNHSITESTDLWSFGVIAYELLTLNRFSCLNNDCQIYINNIQFPDEFEYEIGKDLVKKVLCLNPSKRLNIEQIQQHEYFKNIDWIELESSYWKSKTYLASN